MTTQSAIFISSVCTKLVTVTSGSQVCVFVWIIDCVGTEGKCLQDFELIEARQGFRMDKWQVISSKSSVGKSQTYTLETLKNLRLYTTFLHNKRRTLCNKFWIDFYFWIKQCSVECVLQTQHLSRSGFSSDAEHGAWGVKDMSLRRGLLSLHLSPTKD